MFEVHHAGSHSNLKIPQESGTYLISIFLENSEGCFVVVSHVISSVRFLTAGLHGGRVQCRVLYSAET